MSILFVQPILTSYRSPVFKDVASLSNTRVCVVASDPESNFGDVDVEGLDYVKIHWLKFGLLKFLSPVKWFALLRRNDVVIHFADYKYITLWVGLIVAKLFKTKFILWGQGGYKRSGIIVDIVYTLAVYLSNGYICYTDYSKNALKKKIPQVLHDKLYVVSNTLYMSGSLPFVRGELGLRNDVLFIGRIRDRSNLNFLVGLVKKLKLRVHVVGGGDLSVINELTVLGDMIRHHGIVYDENKIRDISKSCFVGIYPGDAGLSVVHYMALGLPVICHSQIDSHMGPEPSYIKHGYNGLLFRRNDQNDLVNQMSKLKYDDGLKMTLSAGAVETFGSLSVPTMGRKLTDIVGAVN